jgi:hypothetical protein
MLAVLLIAAQVPFGVIPALPTGATVIETAALPSSLHPHRLLVLWMLNREEHCVDGWKDTWSPICPGSTCGCCYSGPTRVSLIDTVKNRVINTVNIHDGFDDKDVFAIPYLLGPGGPYRVEEPFGMPTLLNLGDYNGDGIAAEFPLFQALTCSDLLSTLLGYSPRRDQVLQYPIRVTAQTFDHRVQVFSSVWLNQLFLMKPITPGHWRYTSEHPGSYSNLRAHIHEEYEAWYRPKTESFDVHLVERERE